MKPLDIGQRYNIAEAIALKWTKNADLKEIESYFFNAQFEYLDDLTDDELLAIAEDEEITE